MTGNDLIFRKPVSRGAGNSHSLHQIPCCFLILVTESVSSFHLIEKHLLCLAWYSVANLGVLAPCNQAYTGKHFHISSYSTNQRESNHIYNSNPLFHCVENRQICALCQTKRLSAGPCVFFILLQSLRKIPAVIVILLPSIRTLSESCNEKRQMWCRNNPTHSKQIQTGFAKLLELITVNMQKQNRVGPEKANGIHQLCYAHRNWCHWNLSDSASHSRPARMQWCIPLYANNFMTLLCFLKYQTTELWRSKSRWAYIQGTYIYICKNPPVTTFLRKHHTDKIQKVVAIHAEYRPSN